MFGLSIRWDNTMFRSEMGRDPKVALRLYSSTGKSSVRISADTPPARLKFWIFPGLSGEASDLNMTRLRSLASISFRIRL